jgi:hypothetical protein
MSTDVATRVVVEVSSTLGVETASLIVHDFFAVVSKQPVHDTHIDSLISLDNDLRKEL